MIDILRTKTPHQVRRAVSGFADKYALDWDEWLAVSESERPPVFVKILGKWQAVRPKALRRVRARSDEHASPYIEDLLESAAPQLRVLSSFVVGRAKPLSTHERTALSRLWTVLSKLPQGGQGSCVSITKATLLLTAGRVGPAFDSKVRGQLGCRHLQTAREWADVLDLISDDIRAFEELNRSTLAAAVPRRFSALANGRLYDMALGPR